ncbi:glycosyltransferase family 4 protein [Acidovorax sp. SRB_24]|uniref:glycosyltransferase family 4 protein n=1 Tax=Acidovorax sp. SRB_24 TaxID=1962700 RepID=UPI00197C8222|nr:glycosyltransferase family 4 protein [Acidovorax sp. SRB_24]
MSQKIRTLLFSTLYPSSARPVHGIFVETRLRELLKSGQVETQVVAPVPWFPLKHSAFGAWARMAATPAHEMRNGVQVHHPRYLLPPKVGQNIAPYVLAAGALPTIRRLIRDGFNFDLIDAHFFYPDGVAAAIIARKLGKPFVCTARGSDITLYRQFATPNRLIRGALAASSANIGVCTDLVAQMIELGADPAKSLTLRNGVDLVRFQVMDRAEARRQLGLPEQGLVLVSVGHLVEVKGHHLVIELLSRLPEARLVIVGSGPWLQRLQSMAQSLGVQDRVTFAGSQPNEHLKTYYSAASALVLASSREGWANVLLEAMACGTPVVATRVNGTPEVVASPRAGRLASARDVAHLQKALSELLAAYPEPAQVRAYAELFSWEDTTRMQCELFTSVLAAK